MNKTKQLMLVVIALILSLPGCAEGDMTSSKTGSSLADKTNVTDQTTKSLKSGEQHSTDTESGIETEAEDDGKQEPEPDYEAMNPPVPADGYISEYVTYEYTGNGASDYIKTEYHVYDGEETVIIQETRDSWREGNVDILKREQTGMGVNNLFEDRYIYDDSKKVLKRESYYNGELSFFEDYEYDHNGKLLRTVDHNEIMNETTVEEYENGVKVSKTTTDDNDLVKDLIEYINDDDGKVVEEYRYSLDKLSNHTVWHYFEDVVNAGRKQRTIYDANGIMTRIDCFDSHGNYDFSWMGKDNQLFTLTEYDGDRKISKSEVSYQIGQYYFGAFTKYCYSGHGKLLQELNYNADGTTKDCTVYYYDERGRRIKEETYKGSSTYNLEKIWSPLELIDKWYEQATINW